MKYEIFTVIVQKTFRFISITEVMSVCTYVTLLLAEAIETDVHSTAQAL